MGLSHPRENYTSCIESPNYVLKGQRMNALSIFKVVAELAVSTGVGAIVSNASRAAVPEGAHFVKKASIAVGTFILSNMVAEQAVKYTKEKIDSGLEEVAKGRAILDTIKEQHKQEDEPLSGTIQDN